LSIKKLTIDHTRGLYVQQDDDGTRETPYRSRRSAAAVADYMRWRGYKINIINASSNPKKKGEIEMNDLTTAQSARLAEFLHRIDARGATAIAGYQRTELFAAGLVTKPKQGRKLEITPNGRALMAQYPPESAANPYVDPSALDDDMTAWNEYHAPQPPTPTQSDSSREALKAIRDTLLAVIRTHIDGNVQPLVDAVQSINALLDCE